MNLYFNTYKTVFRLDPTLAAEYAADPNDPIRMSYRSTGSTALLTETIQFGEGYKQVQQTGLRPIQRSFQLSFDNRSRVVIRALIKFFEGENDPNSIYYRVPSEYFYLKLPFPWQDEDAQPLKFILKSSPAVRPQAFDAWSLSVEIEEWFGQ